MGTCDIVFVYFMTNHIHYWLSCGCQYGEADYIVNACAVYVLE